MVSKEHYCRDRAQYSSKAALNDRFKLNDADEHSYLFHIITYEYRKTEICYQTQICTSQKSLTENMNNIRIYSLKCQNCSTETKLFS